MKIKELKWEDCTPTISSNVVSRAQVLGYTLEVVKSSDGESFELYVNGAYMFSGIQDVAGAKRYYKEWVEACIEEVVEETHLKAAEIQWKEGPNGFLVGDGGMFAVDADNRAYEEKYDHGKYYHDSLDIVHALTRDGAKAACQARKQQMMERFL